MVGPGRDPRAQLAWYHAIIEHAAVAIVVLTTDGDVDYASPSAEALFGWRADELEAGQVFALVHPDDRPLAEEAFANTARTPGLRIPIELRIAQRAGGYRYVEVVANNLMDDPAVGGVVVYLHDLTERRILEQELAYRALHDGLTGLANRGLFFDRLGHALRRASRSGSPLAVLFVDIDDFKAVNDGFSHAAGDELLVSVAARLLHSVRPGDTVARLGGDEFVVVCEDLNDGAGALVVAERVLEALRSPYNLSGRDVGITASVGIRVSRGAAEPEQLVRDADQAMYAAKQSGKDRAVVSPLTG